MATPMRRASDEAFAIQQNLNGDGPCAERLLTAIMCKKIEHLELDKVEVLRAWDLEPEGSNLSPSLVCT